ncbi:MULTISPECIES: amidohydrolase family protein [unclassified Mycobacterium]|uniref:amidohydrolase family protein n=1 Tax=unclassified Mycobacterium TaxID=2642494 RepID=UPI0029C6E781|nr:MULTISPECIES: amidohydrolase family protein [unclassified Mycobacterium]
MRNGHRVITLEEHFATADYRQGDGGALLPQVAAMFADRIDDIEQYRLPEMDRSGIDVQVLSLTGPGVQQETDAELAIERARRSNDALAKVVEAYPARFRAFAALPTQDPLAAARELERCVTELGFVGALVNGHTNGVYLDDARYEPLWATLTRIGVPLYLHPVFPAVMPAVLEGYPEMSAAAWGWGFETASHALRLVLSGLFDRHPTATLILGHMGEGLPFALGRLDDRWSIMRHTVELDELPSCYVRRNLFVTTAGVESHAPLACAISELGAERVLFSVDYPYQSIDTSAEFMATAPIAEHERALIFGQNAESLLALDSVQMRPAARIAENR